MYRKFLIFGILLLLIGCKSTETKKDSLVEMKDESVNLYAFIGKKISVQKVERDTTKPEKFIVLNGDTVVQKVIYTDQKFKAKYQVLENVYNELETDTIEFTVLDHYGRPKFGNHENVLLYVSFYKEERIFYHQKYQFDPVKKTKNGNWEGLDGESIEELFNEKKEGVLTARGVFDE